MARLVDKPSDTQYFMVFNVVSKACLQNDKCYTGLTKVYTFTNSTEFLLVMKAFVKSQVTLLDVE